MRPVHSFELHDGLTAEHSEMIEILNDRLTGLAAQRVRVITVDGDLARSKLAWKLATYRQPMLWRVVELADAAAVAWNGHNMLALSLAARSFIETVAELADFAALFRDNFERRDLAQLDLLVMTRSFATRDEYWLAKRPQFRAKSVLTVVEKLNRKVLPGVLPHYELLSERCHPNSYGHHNYFGQLDISTGTTIYSDTPDLTTYFKEIGALAILADKAVKLLDEMQNLIKPIADWHWSIAPISDY